MPKLQCPGNRRGSQYPPKLQSPANRPGLRKERSDMEKGEEAKGALYGEGDEPN
jgi:hypothetical protein